MYHRRILFVVRDMALFACLKVSQLKLDCELFQADVLFHNSPASTFQDVLTLRSL